ncbi:hypothetical protein BH09PAT3_BH09PAT3_0990 [soil metagenome]
MKTRVAEAATISDDMSDVPIVEYARMLTRWDSITGWLPEQGNYQELKEFCGSTIRRMTFEPGIDSSDLDVLLAVGAGISLELNEISVEQRGEPHAFELH